LFKEANLPDFVKVKVNPVTTSQFPLPFLFAQLTMSDCCWMLIASLLSVSVVNISDHLIFRQYELFGHLLRCKSKDIFHMHDSDSSFVLVHW